MNTEQSLSDRQLQKTLLKVLWRLDEHLREQAVRVTDMEKLTVNDHTAIQYSTMAMTIGFVTAAILDTIEEIQKEQDDSTTRNPIGNDSQEG